MKKKRIELLLVLYCKHCNLTSLTGCTKTVIEDLNCIIKGDVNVCWLSLTSLLDLSDVEIKGDFDCRNNDLINLKGSPHTVNSFDCKYNNLPSLKGAPRKVTLHFDCSRNILQNLNGGPETVLGGYLCY